MKIKRNGPRKIDFFMNQFSILNSLKLLALPEKPYFHFANVLKRWSSQKIALEYDLSCIMRKDDISFSQKYGLTL